MRRFTLLTLRHPERPRFFQRAEGSPSQSAPRASQALRLIFGRPTNGLEVENVEVLL